MTKKMNRIAAKGWADLKREQQDQEAKERQMSADLEALRTLRDYLLNNGQGEPAMKLREAIDDYVGFLTGDRTALHAKDGRAIPSPVTKKGPRHPEG